MIVVICFHTKLSCQNGQHLFSSKKKPKYQFATFTAATIGNNNTPMMSCETLNSCRFRENFKLIRLFNNDDERWRLRSIFVAHMGDSMKLLLAD